MGKSIEKISPSDWPVNDSMGAFGGLMVNVGVPRPLKVESFLGMGSRPESKTRMSKMSNHDNKVTVIPAFRVLAELP